MIFLQYRGTVAGFRKYARPALLAYASRILGANLHVQSGEGEWPPESLDGGIFGVQDLALRDHALRLQMALDDASEKDALGRI